MILNILNELAATASTNEKEAILRREQKNDLLKRVFQAAYNPMITYGIKQIPNSIPRGVTSTVLLQQAITSLSSLVSREFTGNAAIQYLTNVLNQLHPDDATVIERIIQRDLRCGTSDSIASRVWAGLVPTFDVMLSHKDISGIKYPAYAQIKSDGARCHMSFQSGRAVAFSRSGKPIELHGTFDGAISKIAGGDGDTLDGELLAIGAGGKILDRKTGNGIVNKAVKGTITKEEAEQLIFVTWDVVDFTSTIPYVDRLGRLSKSSPTDKIRVLETSVVNNKEEAQAFFERCLDAGEEGAMIKNQLAVWQPKRTKDLGKMKAEEVADLVIVDIVEGNGKYQGMLGKFVCQTSDGLVEVGVGSGLSDEERVEYWNKNMIGRVVEVMYNAIISDKNKEVKSLFLPRFLSLREDKNVANTLGELK